MKTETANVRITLWVLLVFFFLPAVGWALPAFPGAEGFGSTTIGGRGGQVIEVTNLNASGAGSLAAAIAVSGPRIVVFRTGGTILLTNELPINNPYITIAGQTAPGGGIAIRGAALRINTHDVVVRGLRIRIGDSPSGPAPDQRDGLGIQQDPVTNNIIVDHCSVSWAIDENISIYGWGHDITFQWNITSEALYNSLSSAGVESYGLLVKDKGSMQRISVHHNLLAHNNERNPEFAADDTGANLFAGEIVNNVVYNWFGYAMRLEFGNPQVNVIGNYCRMGPNSHVHLTNGLKFNALAAGARFYVHDNIGPGRLTNTGDDWLFADGGSAYRSNTPVFTGSGITTQLPDAALTLVLANAGATQPQRDAVDTRVVQDVQNGTGAIIDSQTQVGGWPTLAAGTPPTDTDHDGMPDSWETSHGLNPNSASDGSLDRDSDGYTNVEEYINSLLSGSLPIGTVPNPPVNLKACNSPGPCP